VVELCNFLKDQNMITKLNLRKNNITNTGAKVISDWISEHDNALTSIDLSRNKITRAGGEELLTVLKKIMRI
jgi:Leucine-rich repeat (LRR) protein